MLTRSASWLVLAALLVVTTETRPLWAAERRSARLETFELTSEVFANTRTIRVSLPPSYDPDGDRRYPVVYFLDGVPALDPPGLDAPGAAAALWREGTIPELILVGVDNGGSTRESTQPMLDRASELLPYRDPSWVEPPLPRPRGKLYPDFLFGEVKPEVDRRYRTLPERESTTLAGSSYSAIAALYSALSRPDSVGALILQSPSAHVGEGKLLVDVRRAERLPETIYIDVGDREGATVAIQRAMLSDVEALHEALAARAPGAHLVVDEGGEHTFSAWRRRLPGALELVWTDRPR